MVSDNRPPSPAALAVPVTRRRLEPIAGPRQDLNRPPAPPRSAASDPSPIVTSVPVDQALRVVADHRQIPVLVRQQLQPAVLGVVGVLVLVDEEWRNARW